MNQRSNFKAVSQLRDKQSQVTTANENHVSKVLTLAICRFTRRVVAGAIAS